MSGTINFLEKEKAEFLKSEGFLYNTQKLSDGKEIYCFFDTPELRNKISSHFSNNDFYISKNIYF